LELVFEVAHDDVQLESQDENAQEISLVVVLHPCFLEHDDVHDIFDDDIVVTNRERFPSPLPQPTNTQTSSQINNSELQITTTYVHMMIQRCILRRTNIFSQFRLVQHLVRIKRYTITRKPGMIWNYGKEFENMIKGLRTRDLHKS